MSAQLIDFPTPQVRPTFDEGWAARQGEMKTRGEGKDKTRKLWNKEAARLGGQDVLLAALKRFLREKPEKDGYTHCGLSVWLNQQRADHWLVPEAGNPVAAASCLPPDMRAKALAMLGEPFVVSYLDPATLHPDNFITPKTGYAMDKLKEKAKELKACGLAGIRVRPVS